MAYIPARLAGIIFGSKRIARPQELVNRIGYDAIVRFFYRNVFVPTDELPTMDHRTQFMCGVDDYFQAKDEPENQLRARGWKAAEAKMNNMRAESGMSGNPRNF